MSEAEQVKTPDQEAAASRKAVATEAKKKADAAAKVAEDKVAGKGVKVKALVNMMAKDGTEMIAGKECLLSHEEVARLKSEPRFAKKPHFEEVKAAAAK